jgi:hypothetical protein
VFPRVESTHIYPHMPNRLSYPGCSSVRNAGSFRITRSATQPPRSNFSFSVLVRRCCCRCKISNRGHLGLTAWETRGLDLMFAESFLSVLACNPDACAKHAIYLPPINRDRICIQNYDDFLNCCCQASDFLYNNTQRSVGVRKTCHGWGRGEHITSRRRANLEHHRE